MIAWVNGVAILEGDLSPQDFKQVPSPNCVVITQLKKVLRFHLQGTTSKQNQCSASFVLGAPPPQKEILVMDESLVKLSFEISFSP